MKDFELAIVIIAVIGIVFAIFFVIAGFGSVESSVGHFLKDTLQGTPLEHPAASIESAGNDLAKSAQGAIAFFTGVLVILGLLYVGANSKS
jgi:hypothetical protein